MKTLLLTIFVFLTACGGTNEFSGSNRSQGQNLQKADEAAANADATAPSDSVAQDQTPTNSKSQSTQTLKGGVELEQESLLAGPNGYSGFWVTLSTPEVNDGATSFFEVTLSAVESVADDFVNVFNFLISNF